MSLEIIIIILVIAVIGYLFLLFFSLEANIKRKTKYLVNAGMDSALSEKFVRFLYNLVVIASKNNAEINEKLFRESCTSDEWIIAFADVYKDKTVSEKNKIDKLISDDSYYPEFETINENSIDPDLKPDLGAYIAEEKKTLKLTKAELKKDKFILLMSVFRMNFQIISRKFDPEDIFLQYFIYGAAIGALNEAGTKKDELITEDFELLILGTCSVLNAIFFETKDLKKALNLFNNLKISKGQIVYNEINYKFTKINNKTIEKKISSTRKDYKEIIDLGAQFYIDLRNPLFTAEDLRTTFSKYFK